MFSLQTIFGKGDTFYYVVLFFAVVVTLLVRNLLSYIGLCG